VTGARNLSERAIILAPGGRDAEIATQILREAGFGAEAAGDLPRLSELIVAGAGLAIIAVEAAQDADLHPLSELLSQQPPWSDLPIILLTHRGGGPEKNPLAARLAEVLGNVSFLERPFHPTTLASVVRAAVRGRRRQYEARARLDELADERSALSKLTQTLEERVNDRTAELMTEVAAREKAQERLVQSQKMETIGQLTGGVAHDFNNLLMAVMGNLDILRKRWPDDARAQRLIEGALQGAKRGATLTQRMLAFARQQELKTGSADLATLLAGMRDLLDRTLGPQIELTVDASTELPPAQVDPNQIELAVLNLAINARDAMPAGGNIHIALQKHTQPEPSNWSGDYLRLSVSDTGTGMDEETLKKAIEPFFSTKPVGKGTGLGLSMIHGLVVQLGGRLQLESEVGKGTKATLWLPVASQPASTAPQSGPEPVTSGRVATILVVDDDPLIAGSAVNMLEDLGHIVLEANSAKRALEILDRGQKVDLMMTDQAMPGMTGTELADVVRLKRPGLPILLVTGYAELPPGSSVSVPRLSKPYLQAQLQEHIDRLLPKIA
jgi:signal transduction histidine kinase